jgi:2-oxoglutarate dehydrogenase E2 component (dihydrolipoamide succinyltransferase)
MAHLVKIPAVGESITEGTLSRWLVADGAIVTDSTPLFELETDKISTEVQSGVAGKVTFKVKEGEVLAIGAVVAEIDPAVTAPAAAPKAASAATKLAAEAPAAAKQSGPAAAKILAESGVNPATVSGTGKDGRITKGDALAASQAKPAAAAPAPAPSPAPSVPAVTSVSGVTRKKMTPLRQRIAQRLVQAQHTAAILTTFNEVDMTAAMDLRKKWKEDFEKKHGIGLGFMSMFTIAAVQALKKYPGINSQIDGTDVVSFDHINVGIAVGTEKGLVVPVVKHAENLGFADIEKAIRGYALKAREGKLGIEDMQGGTFTITNGGVYGSLMSTPIINPPQSGILGMHAIKDRPMAVNGQVVIRPMMYIALSYDHRIVDGAEAVGFLVRVKELIEAPERLILGL